jgi:hypothetical protein
MFSIITGIFFPSMRRAPRMIDELIREGTFDGNFEDRRYAIEVFDTTRW